MLPLFHASHTRWVCDILPIDFQHYSAMWNCWRNFWQLLNLENWMSLLVMRLWPLRPLASCDRFYLCPRPTWRRESRLSAVKKARKNVSFNTIKFSCLSMTRLTSKLKTKIIYNPQKNSWNHNIAQLIGLMPLCFDVIFQNLQILVKNSSKPRLHSAETKRKRYLTLKNWFPTLSTLFCML